MAFCRDNRIAGARKNGKEWMIPSDDIKPLDMRTKEFVNYKFEQKETITTIPYSKSNSEEKVINSFYEKYNKKNNVYNFYSIPNMHIRCTCRS